MSKIETASRFNSAFIDDGVPSLADVRERLEAAPNLSPTRRRDLRSAITSIARLIDRRPEETPANINWLHIRLRRVAPAAKGISKKRFANIKSDALKALELTGCSRERSDWLKPSSPAWQKLLDSVPDKHDRWKLSQLAQYCSALGAEPNHLESHHVHGLLTTLIEERFANRPEHAAANAIKTWNRLRGEIAGWPDIELAPLPPKRKPWTLSPEDFPQSLRDDVERWIDRLANPDPFDQSGPIKALRPSTIKHRRFQIREMASALVLSGYPIEAMTSLGCLVELENLKAGLRFMMSRFDDKPTEAIHGLAMGMNAIARHHVKVDDAQREQIKGICRRLNLEVDGLRAKNRQRLLQLEDPHSLAKLLHLPAKLIKLSRRPGLNRRKAALMVQAALAIEILLYAPMRVGNLSTLTLERHLKPIGNGRNRRTQIYVPGNEVKNSKELHYELGPQTTKLLDLYLAEAQPVLLREPSDYLFPAQKGGPKRTEGLSRLIKETIREHTGLEINAHLFRSIAGKLHSLAAPGDFTTLSHVLADSLRTTMKSYSQFETRNSLKHYQRSVDEARRRLTTQSRQEKRKP